MQPRDIQHLEHIADYCDDITETLVRIGGSQEIFNRDITLQYSIAFCILQIGELAGQLSTELRSTTADEINWKEIRGMRNIVVHDYGEVKLSVVWAVANYDIPVLKAFCERKLHEIQ